MQKIVKIIFVVILAGIGLYTLAGADAIPKMKAKMSKSKESMADSANSPSQNTPDTNDMNKMKSSNATQSTVPSTEASKPLTPTTAEGVSEEESAKIINKLKSLYPQVTVEYIKKSPLPHWLEINSGNFILYVSEDARYLFYGELLDLNEPEEINRNLTENEKRGFRMNLLKNLKVEDTVVYSAKNQPEKAYVWAFMDTDCSYCRKFHEEQGRLNDLGIELRYAAYPRAGVGSPTYKNMVSAWCSDERTKSMDMLMKGETVPSKECDNPVANQFLLGQKLGITGTPTVILEDGTIIPGFMPADKLATEAIKHKPVPPKS